MTKQSDPPRSSAKKLVGDLRKQKDRIMAEARMLAQRYAALSDREVVESESRSRKPKD
jgi:hypothetical protein